MPSPTMSTGTSCELRPPSDSSNQCSTSGRLAIPTTPLCKQPAAQSPVLSGLTRLPARLAKLLSKAHTARATHCGDLPHLEASDAHASSGDHGPFLAISAHPSKATTATTSTATTSAITSTATTSATSGSISTATITATSASTSTSSFTPAPCSSSSSSSSSAHPEHATAQPATDRTVLAGSWPMPHAADASPSPCQPTVPQPPPLSTRPSATSPPPQRIGTAGISASSFRKGSDHAGPDRPHLPGLQHHQQSTPHSPRICMYITELGCADLAASWIHHSETASLSAASLAAAKAWAPPPAHAAAAPDALQTDAPSRGLERQATVHLPAARRASCPDCPQAFDPTMGDLALLDCPLVQSLMLSTM